MRARSGTSFCVGEAATSPVFTFLTPSPPGRLEELDAPPGELIEFSWIFGRIFCPLKSGTSATSDAK